MVNQYERVQETTNFYVESVKSVAGRDGEQWEIEGKFPWTPNWAVRVWTDKASAPSWLNPSFIDENGQPQVKETPYAPPYEAKIVASRGKLSRAGDRGCKKCFSGQGHTSGTDHDGSQNYHYKWYINEWMEETEPQRNQMSKGSQPHTFTAPNIIQQAPQVQQAQQPQQAQQQQGTQTPKDNDSLRLRICAFNSIEKKDEKGLDTIKYLTDQYERILSGKNPETTSSSDNLWDSGNDPSKDDDQVQDLIDQG